MGVVVAVAMLFLAAANLIVGSLMPPEAQSRSPGALQRVDWGGIVALSVWLAATALVACMALSVQIKRWHDRDKSAWWLLIHAVPAIGNTWALVECGFIEGTPGPNRYGLVPGSERSETDSG